MADHFVDAVNGNNGNSGHDMDNAWLTVEYALESGSLTAGDIVWIRRNVNENPTSSISINQNYDGTSINFIYVIGWPRNETSGTADFTNNSVVVDNVSGISMDREKHASRNITGPDGKTYYIELVTDSNTFELDRKYAGDGVAAGSFTIEKDVDYDLAQDIDDTGWTITKATWNADADDVVTIDFNAGAYRLQIVYSDNYSFRNIELTNSTDSYLVYCGGFQRIEFVNCLLYNSSNIDIFRIASTDIRLVNCIMHSTNGGSSVGVLLDTNGCVRIFNSSFYNLGKSLYCSAQTLDVYLDNVNLGVQGASTDYEFQASYHMQIKGRDVRFNDSSTIYYLPTNLFHLSSYIDIENYNKVQGTHRKIIPFTATITSNDFSGVDVKQRLFGSHNVIEVLMNINSNYVGRKAADEKRSDLLAPIIIGQNNSAVIYVDDISVARKYRFYINSEQALTSSEIWLELEYVTSCDSNGNYTKTIVKSTQSVSARTDVDDWTNYIESPSIQPAVASNIYVKLFYSKYHASNKCYIDNYYKTIEV